MTIDLDALERLEQALVPGKWVSAHINPQGGASNWHEPYSMWVHGGGPRSVIVDHSVCIHADDMDFIAAIRNAAPELIRMARSRSVLEGCMWAVSKGGRSICQPPKHGQSVPSAEQPGLCVSQIAESETQQSLSSMDGTQPQPAQRDDPVIDGYPLNEGIPPAPDKDY